MWEECKTLYSMPFALALEVIEDAKCHGFEFKLEQGKLYSREIEQTSDNE